MSEVTIREACMKIWDRTVSGVEDGCGYNRVDKNFISDVISTDPWTDKQKKAVYNTLTKYEGQLQECGIDLENDVEPPPDVELSSEKLQGVEVTYNNKQIEVEIGQTDKFHKIKNLLKNNSFSWEPDDQVWYSTSYGSIESTIDQLRKVADNFNITQEAKQALQNNQTYEVEVYYGDENTIHIDMEYDCNNFESIKSTIKDELDGQYDPDRYIWTVGDKPESILNALRTYDNVKIDKYVRKQANREDEEKQLYNKLSQAMEVDYTPPSSLNHSDWVRPYQKAIMMYASQNPKTLMAEEMGIGKTLCTLTAIEDNNALPALVIGPANSKQKWRDEINKWYPHRSSQILSGFTDQELQNTDYTIVNYDILHKRVNNILQRDYKTLVCDEIHYCRNDSKRSKATQTLADKIEPDYRYGLTGTPFQNAPAELMRPLRILGRLEELGGWEQFASRYCGGRYVAIIACKGDKYKAVKQCLKEVNAKHSGESTKYYVRMSKANEFRQKIYNCDEYIDIGDDVIFYPEIDQRATAQDEMHKRLRETCMVRHDEEQLSDELPDTNRVLTPVTVDMESYEAIEDEVISEARAKHKKELKELDDEIQATDNIEKKKKLQKEYDNKKDNFPLELIKNTKVRHELCEQKFDHVKDLANDILQQKDKLVIFTKHKPMAKWLSDDLDASVRIDGDCTEDQKYERQQAFQNEPEVKTMIGNMDATSEVVEFDAADVCIFAEFDDNPQNHKQCEGRLRRQSQESDYITAYYAYAKGTIEDGVIERLERKFKMFQAGIEGKADPDSMF